MDKNENVARLLDLIFGRYLGVKNTRGDEYATYNHYEAEQLDGLSGEEKLEIFTRAYADIPSDRLDIYFWLASSYQVPLHKSYFSILRNEICSEKLETFFKLMLGSIQSSWSQSDFAELSSGDVALFNEKCESFEIDPHYIWQKLRK